MGKLENRLSPVDGSRFAYIVIEKSSPAVNCFLYSDDLPPLEGPTISYSGNERVVIPAGASKVYHWYLNEGSRVKLGFDFSSDVQVCVLRGTSDAPWTAHRLKTSDKGCEPVVEGSEGEHEFLAQDSDTYYFALTHGDSEGEDAHGAVDYSVQQSTFLVETDHSVCDDSGCAGVRINVPFGVLSYLVFTTPSDGAGFVMEATLHSRWPRAIVISSILLSVCVVVFFVDAWRTTKGFGLRTFAASILSATSKREGKPKKPSGSSSSSTNASTAGYSLKKSWALMYRGGSATSMEDDGGGSECAGGGGIVMMDHELSERQSESGSEQEDHAQALEVMGIKTVMVFPKGAGSLSVYFETPRGAPTGWRYEVECSPEPDFEPDLSFVSVVYSGAPPWKKLSFDRLREDTAYHVRVVTSHDDAPSLVCVSEAKNMATLCRDPLDPPEVLWVQVNVRHAVVRWSAKSTADEYELSCSVVGGGSTAASPRVVSITQPTTFDPCDPMSSSAVPSQHELTGLEPGTKYCVVVRVRRRDTWSALSDKFTFWTLDDMTFEPHKVFPRRNTQQSQQYVVKTAGLPSRGAGYESGPMVSFTRPNDKHRSF